MASAQLSGMECAMAMNSTENGPISTLPPCGTTLIGTSGAPGSDRRLRAQKLGGETRGVKLAAKLRPDIGDGADMILMRMGDDEPDEILLHLLDEAGVGDHHVNAGQLRPGEGDSAINHQPFHAALRAEAVKGEIHADFAETSERHEDEFVICRVHESRPFLCFTMPWFVMLIDGRAAAAQPEKRRRRR